MLLMLAFFFLMFDEGPFPWLFFLALSAFDIGFSFDYIRKLQDEKNREQAEKDKLRRELDRRRYEYNYDDRRMAEDIRSSTEAAGVDPGELSPEELQDLLQKDYEEEKQTRNY